MCALNISLKRNKKTGNLIAPCLTYLASRPFCHLLIIFANSLDQDKDQQNVGPDLDPNCLTLTVFLKDFFFKKLILKKSQQTTAKA